MKRIGVILLILSLIPIAIANEEVSGVSSQTSLTTGETFPDIDASNLRIVSTYYDPSPAEPGNLLDLWIAIQNLGNEDFKKGAIQLVPRYPFSLNPGESGIETISLLPSYKEQRLEYRLRVDEAALEGTYPLDIKICANADCTSTIRTNTIDLTVKTGGKPKIEVGLEEFATFTSGTTGKFTIHIVNRGKLDTQFLIVELLPSEDNEYTILSPARRYIGSLESDDFDTEDFTIFIETSASSTKEINLPLKIEYSDENFKEYTQLETVPLRIYSPTDLKRMQLVANNNSHTKILGGLIVLGGIYFWWRRQKKNKE